MSKIVPFNFESKSVRVLDQAGELKFVAKDVCNVLNHSDTSKAVSRLDDDEKGTSIVRTPSGDQEMLVINESGLYSLILTSRKAEAKRFKKWITSEVLPSIRKTGSYGLAENLENPAWLRSALLDYSDKVISLQAQVDEQTPMVKSYERFAIGSDGSLCITDAAKSLCKRPKDLFSWLQRKKWIYRRTGGSGYIAYQDKIQSGFLEHKITEVSRSDGSSRMSEQVRVTAKGIAKLGKQFEEEEAGQMPPPSISGTTHQTI